MTKPSSSKRPISNPTLKAIPYNLPKSPKPPTLGQTSQNTTPNVLPGPQRSARVLLPGQWSVGLAVRLVSPVVCQETAGRELSPKKVIGGYGAKTSDGGLAREPPPKRSSGRPLDLILTKSLYLLKYGRKGAFLAHLPRHLVVLKTNRFENIVEPQRSRSERPPRRPDRAGKAEGGG